MNRVLLVNRTAAPSREELSTSEREAGELLFANFAGLEWAGYMLSPTFQKKAANWVIPNGRLGEFLTFVETLTPNFQYAFEVRASALNKTGGQCEITVL